MPERMPETNRCRSICRNPKDAGTPKHAGASGVSKVSPRTAAAPSGAGLGRIAPASWLSGLPHYLLLILSELIAPKAAGSSGG